MFDFPYGRAPLAILILALLSGGAIGLAALQDVRQAPPDLMFATFVKEHAEAYQEPVRVFEREHGVTVHIQVVDQRALQSRLQSALQAGADVPDMVELLDGTMGIFTKGPLEAVGFVDLTERVRAAGLDQAVVTSRFTKWSSRGHIFALPHDIHPVTLAYRRDLVEELGIDVSQLDTWAKFAAVAREQVVKDLNGDGVPDRYMIDLPYNGGDAIRLLILQKGGRIFDDAGDVAFDSPEAADVIVWYIQQIQGPDRIAFDAGWGQTLAKSAIDGLCLFYICPDWRTRQLQLDIASLEGKMAVMPLPAWEPGGRRTSTWGGTGLAITKQCERQDLAWQLAMHLYYDPKKLGERFAQTQILPPLREAWDQPQLDQPVAYFSNQRLGRIFAELAPDVPAEQSSPYMTLAVNKLNEAFTNAALYHREHGENGLRSYVERELERTARRVREVMARNVFLRVAGGDDGTAGEEVTP